MFEFRALVGDAAAEVVRVAPESFDPLGVVLPLAAFLPHAALVLYLLWRYWNRKTGVRVKRRFRVEP